MKILKKDFYHKYIIDMGYKNKTNKQYQREYYLKTKDQRNEKKQAYYEKNKERILQYNEEYYKRNLNFWDDYRRNYYIKNRERILEYNSKYYYNKKFGSCDEETKSSTVVKNNFKISILND